MIEYLLLALMCVLATAKVTVQTKASKSILKDFKDVSLFNCGVFLVIAVVFSYSLYNSSPVIWLPATICAVLTVTFQLTYTNALSSGSVPLTVMMVNLSILIPTLFSVFYYGEELSVFQIIGIVFIVGAIFCMTGKEKQAKYNGKWLFFSIVASLSNSFANVVLKIFNSSVYAPEREAFISASYVIAFVLTAIVFLILSFRKHEKTEKKSYGKAFLLCVVLVGIILAAFQWTNNYTLSIVDGSIVFPVYSGGTIILSTLVGVVLFKDKLTKRQFLGICLGLIAVILMNIS